MKDEKNDKKLNDPLEQQPAAAEELPDEITMTKEEFERVKAHIDGLKQENEKMVALAQRVQADFDNFRKRNAAIHLDSVEEGGRNVIAGLLPVIDNLERALSNAEGIDLNWMEGLVLVQRQLMDTLRKYGLNEIPADGMFDPNLHEAVLQEEAEGAQSGSVLEVLQKGYKVKDRIIRHSMVKVAK